MAKVSEGLRGNQKWFLLENKSSSRSKRGHSESLIPMRMRRVQNIENALQRWCLSANHKCSRPTRVYRMTQMRVVCAQRFPAKNLSNIYFAI